MKSTRHIVNLMYIVGFLDLLGVSMLIPILSKHARDIGASLTVAGLIGSLYGFLQLISGPVVGRWSDTSGRRFVLLFSLIMSTVGYAMLGVSNTILLLTIARVQAGLFKHTQEVSKGYLADIVPKADRSLVFGRFNSVSSVGFIFGPIVGGHIADLPNGFYIVAAFTAATFLVNFFLVLFFLPSDDKPRQSGVHSVPPPPPSQTGGHSSFLQSFREVDWRNMWDIFAVQFLLSFAVIVYRSNFATMLDYRYAASSRVTGYMISYSGVVGTVSAFFVGNIARLYSNDARLMLHSSVAQVVAIAGMTFAPNLWILALWQTPLSIANAIARVASTNVTLTRSGGERNFGTLMGLSASTLSMARMMSPAVGGFASEYHVSGPGIVGTAMAVAGVVIQVAVSRNTVVIHEKTL